LVNLKNQNDEIFKAFRKKYKHLIKSKVSGVGSKNHKKHKKKISKLKKWKEPDELQFEMKQIVGIAKMYAKKGEKMREEYIKRKLSKIVFLGYNIESSNRSVAWTRTVDRT
jgi:hypothetical protein